MHLWNFPSDVMYDGTNTSLITADLELVSTGNSLRSWLA